MKHTAKKERPTRKLGLSLNRITGTGIPARSHQFRLTDWTTDTELLSGILSEEQVGALVTGAYVDVDFEARESFNLDRLAPGPGPDHTDLMEDLRYWAGMSLDHLSGPAAGRCLEVLERATKVLGPAPGDPESDERNPMVGDIDGDSYRPGDRFTNVCHKQTHRTRRPCIREDGHPGKHVAVQQTTGRIVDVF